MQQVLYATRQFVKDFERLGETQKQDFARIGSDLLRDIHSHGFHKLEAKVGTCDAYANDFTKGWRFIWTKEGSQEILFRCLAPHDLAYRVRMPRLQRANLDKAVPFQTLLPQSAPAKVSVAPPAGMTGEPRQRNREHHWIYTPVRETAEPVPLSAVEQAKPEPVVFADEPETVYALDQASFERLLQGSIASWMLFVKPEHNAFVTRRFSGPARITGPAGSGKTALLLHRAKFEAESGNGRRVRVLAFTHSVAEALRQLLHQFCNGEEALLNRIEVSTFFSFVAEVAGAKANFVGREHRNCLKSAIAACSTTALMASLNKPEHLLSLVESEIEGSLKGRGLTPEEYLDRDDGHSLNAAGRRELLAIYRHYETAKGGRLDFQDVLLLALHRAKEAAEWQPYALLVDEYQDLSTVGLRMLAAYGNTTGSALVLAGDEAQRLYQDRSTFKELGLDVSGARSVRLQQVYRNTFEIAAFSQSVLKGRGDGEPVDAPEFPGSKPVLAGFRTTADEVCWVSEQVAALLAGGTLPGDVLVQCPTWQLRDKIAGSLRDRSVPFLILDKGSAASCLSPDFVKVTTVHNAKGLESKIAFCAGACNENFESEFRYQGERGQQLMTAMLHVAFTRARDRLYVSFSKTPLRALCAADADACVLAEHAEELLLRAYDRLPRQPWHTGNLFQQPTS